MPDPAFLKMKVLASTVAHVCFFLDSLHSVPQLLHVICPRLLLHSVEHTGGNFTPQPTTQRSVLIPRAAALATRPTPWIAPVAVSATTRRVIKSAPGRAVSRGSGGVGECDGNPAFRRPRLTLASEGLRTGRTLEKSCPLNVCLAAQARLDSKCSVENIYTDDSAEQSGTKKEDLDDKEENDEEETPAPVHSASQFCTAGYGASNQIICVSKKTSGHLLLNTAACRPSAGVQKCTFHSEPSGSVDR
ncbi:uncharacterized protein [Macaca fascicularis]|uniref:uncharacterized protein n=1 Tax=Macaca fascicularis TaxID=9541 RepID=UPI0032B06B93